MAFLETARQPRKLRNPIHTFNVKHMPFAIQPFMIAPVLPGETFKNLLLQSRAVTRPIVNPIIGWWLEYYFFYIQHRDLDGSQDFQSMVLNIEHSMAAQAPSGANPKYYNNTGAAGIDWVGQCLKRVTEEYFRDEGEAWNDYLIDGLPAAALNMDTWATDTLIDITNMPDDAIDQTPTADIAIGELDKAYLQWEHLRAMKLINMSYEDFLKSYGVRGRLAEDPTKPELIRYVRDWTYPSNTINPETGAPSSAVSWAVTERADKDRFFAEPGFIFGVTVARPKVYLAKQKSHLVQFLDNAFAWMPAIMRDEPYTSIKEFSNSAGPLAGNVTNGYVVDLRDLFIYGDQFLSFNPDAATDGTNAIDLPATNTTPNPDVIVKNYPSEAMVDQLFVAAGEEPTQYADDGIMQDGVVRLSILGTQVDHT